jgi:exopolysaccharide biosynthesis protein
VKVKPNDNLAPRTAVGIDSTRHQLWLLVVDGRQSGYSEGMSFHEVATVLRDLGCSDAAMLDGGGSTILGLVDAKGQVQVVNRPSDRVFGFTRVRPLPVLFTLIRPPTEVAP